MTEKRKWTLGGMVFELWVSIVGWAWIITGLAVPYYIVKALFYGEAWWTAGAFAATSWVLYKISFYYQLDIWERQQQAKKRLDESRSDKL